MVILVRWQLMLFGWNSPLFNHVQFHHVQFRHAHSVATNAILSTASRFCDYPPRERPAERGQAGRSMNGNNLCLQFGGI
jgi:hypothetical protein